MELNFNNDTVFFKITSPDLVTKDKNLNINQSLLSFTITEEFGKMTTGSLTLIDNFHVFSRMFRYGMKFEITWGYRKWNSELITPENQSQAFNASYRSGLQCVVVNPRGHADDKGNIYYEINFYSMELLQEKKYRVFQSGTKELVLKQLFSDCGVNEPIIKFTEKDNNVSTSITNNIRQYGTSFYTLTRLAKEWHCIFKIGEDSKGTKIGYFIDTTQIGLDEIQKLIRTKSNLSLTAKEFYYNSGNISNVNSYTWENHIGNSGQGVKLIINKVDGSVIVQRYVAETQTIIDYRLNTDRLKKSFGENASATDIIDKTSQYLSAENFEQVKWAFDPILQTTAPDGIGYTISLKLRGDPFISPSLTVIFKNGFPDELERNRLGKLVSFIILKNTHTINKQGYFTDVEIVDSYTLNGGFLQNTVQLQQLQ